MKRVIAIDGPSGSGKTTIAKLVARELGYRYLDTGALYRAVAFFLRENSLEPHDSDDRIREVLSGAVVRFGDGRVIVNDRDVTERIRSTEMDHYSSVFSARSIVRDFLLQSQRNAAVLDDVVVEGRDTTTVVFPDAQKKIFLDASIGERAKRRYLQYREKGIDITFEEALNAIKERDERAPNALLVDSSHLAIEDVMNLILDFVRKDP